jgi:O-antigen ligase
VPVFSNSQDLSIIPQALAALGAVLALLTLVKRVPSVHVAVLAYCGLVLFWGTTLLSEPELWIDYQSLLKVGLMALACHLVFRSSTQLLLLFGIYCATGVIMLLLNWQQLHALSASMSALSERDRFAGTFENANAAGIYGVTLMLCGCIIFFNSRGWWRWPLVVLGLVGGLMICFFSGSRKAMLGLGLLVLVIPWMASRREDAIIYGRSRNRLKMALILVLSLAAGGLLFSQLPFAERLMAPFTEGVAAESSSEVRFGMLVKALELWSAHPLFGCGFDGFARLSEFGVYSHTTFGEVLCNGGLFGIALLGVFYILPARQLLGMLRGGVSGKQARLGIGLFAFWGMFTLMSFFAVLFDSREFVPMYAAVCGYLQENKFR